MPVLPFPLEWAVAAGAVLVFLTAVVLIWRVRSVRPVVPPPDFTPSPPSEDFSPVEFEDLASPFPEDFQAPQFSDLAPANLTQAGTFAQLQTSTYNLRVETVGERTRYVVNGISYNALDEIPDPKMRQAAGALQNRISNLDTFGQAEKEELRQVVVGNQVTLDAKSPDYNLSIQRQSGQTRFIANGRSYSSLNEIPDLDLRRKAEELLKKMF